MSAGNESTASEYGISVSIDTVESGVPGVSDILLILEFGELTRTMCLGVSVETNQGTILVLSSELSGMQIPGYQRAATFAGIPVFTRKPSESSDGHSE